MVTPAAAATTTATATAATATTTTTTTTTLEEPCSPGVPGEMEIYNRYSMEDITNYYSYSNRDIGYSMYPHVRFMTKMGTYHKL